VIVKKGLLDVGLKYHWVSFLLVLLIFAGYSLRSVILYNFELVFFFILITLVYLLFKKKRYKQKWPQELVVWSGFLTAFCAVIVVLNLIYLPLTEVNFHKMQIALLMVGFIALTWLLFLLKPTIDFFWYFLMGASVLMVFRAVLELSSLGGFSLEGLSSMGRLGNALGNPIPFGLFANTLFILMIGGVIWAYKKHPVLLCFWLLLLFLNFLMVILSQTRTAWVGWGEAIIGWGAYYIYLAYRHKVLLKLGVGMVFLVAFLGWVNMTIPATKVLKDRASLVFSDMDQYVEGDNPLTSVGLRLSMYGTAVTMIQEKPYLGYGSEGFLEQFKEASQAFFLKEFNLKHDGLQLSHVHNQFLMTWVQYGVIPVVLLLFLFIYLIRFFWKELRQASEENKPIFIAGLVFIGSMMVAFMVESPLEFATYSAHYWLFTTLLFVFGLLIKTNQKSLDS